MGRLQHLRRVQGFTLVALMIVAVFAALFTFLSLQNRMTENRVRLTEALAEEINWVLEGVRRYYLMNGVFPETWNDLIAAGVVTRPTSDPFGGVINIAADNGGVVKTFTMTVSGGVAATDFGDMVVRRVPLARRISPTQIEIRFTNLALWVDKEIVYSGVHQDGDMVDKMPCLGGLTNYAFAAPAAVKSSDGTPLYAFRVWLTDNGNSYTVNCKRVTEDENGEATTVPGDCYAWVVQICH